MTWEVPYYNIDGEIAGYLTPDHLEGTPILALAEAAARIAKGNFNLCPNICGYDGSCECGHRIDNHGHLVVDNVPCEGFGIEATLRQALIAAGYGHLLEADE